LTHKRDVRGLVAACVAGLIAHADAAVYVAKRLGRNQVQTAAPLAA
jgi:GGDEF domain-containing protein